MLAFEHNKIGGYYSGVTLEFDVFGTAGEVWAGTDMGNGQCPNLRQTQPAVVWVAGRSG